MARELILVERLSSGFYRASRGNDWIDWDPSREPTANRRYVGTASSRFLRDLRDLGLGRGCLKCGQLQYAHDIDGEERAECDGFEGPED